MKSDNNISTARAAEHAEVVASLEHVGMLFDSYQSRVLTDVTLTLRRGEVVALLGPEGAGKTTLLKILAGRLRPSEGKVRVFGRSPGRTGSRIGYLAQTPNEAQTNGIGRWLGVFGNGPERRPTAKDHAPQSPSLSRLQQAVLGNRDLIVLDEPLTDLEPPARNEAVDLIRTLASRGKTVIFSAPSLAQAAGVCDRVAMIYAGRIQGVGTLAELLATPDGIRITSPVLPPAAAERVLVALRRELLADGLLTGGPAGREHGSHAHDHGAAPSAQTPVTSTATDAVLAPLVNSAGATETDPSPTEAEPPRPAPKSRA